MSRNNISLISLNIILEKRFAKKSKDDHDDYDENIPEGEEPETIPAAAKYDIEKQEPAAEDEFGAKDYRAQMSLKSDHASRALWVVSVSKEPLNSL